MSNIEFIVFIFSFISKKDSNKCLYYIILRKKIIRAKIVKVKIWKMCNTVESDTCKFDVERHVCKKCRYQSKIKDTTKQYYKDHYIKHKSDILV